MNRGVTADFVEWSWENHLLTHTSKIQEVVIGYRRTATPPTHTLVDVQGSDIEMVDSSESEN